MKPFELYIDGKVSESDEQKFVLRDFHVDHREYKQDILHKHLHDEYEQDHRELNNSPRNHKRMKVFDEK